MIDSWLVGKNYSSPAYDPLMTRLRPAYDVGLGIRD